MTILRNIITPPPQNHEYGSNKISQLQHSSLPNYVFGGGSGAVSVANFLLKEGIGVEGFCESAYYYKPNKKILDRPVLLVDELLQQDKKHNLVIGASGKSIYPVIQAERKKGNDVFVFDTTKPLFQMSYDWVKENIDDLQRSFDLLADDLSRETFLSFIDDKAHCVNVDIKPLWELWNSDQYFNDLYPFDHFQEHALIDCGAWIGDTAEEFLSFLKDKNLQGKVYAFEPEPDNYKKLVTTAERVGNIECYPYAVGDKKQDVFFNAGNSSSSSLSSGADGIKIPMMPVDELLSNKEISLIKMDLEGNEENALNGMKYIIRQNSPMLAICVYHKVDDLIRIPNCINSNRQKYMHYLRHHSSTSYETVWYAVPIA